LHQPSQGRHQHGSSSTQFFMMMESQFAEDPFAFGGKSEQNLAAVILGALAAYVTSGFEPIDEFHGAVMTDLHAVGKLLDAGPDACRHALDSQHELILTTLETSLLHGLLAEMEKLTDVITKVRQGLIVRQGELPHAPMESSTLSQLYRKTIHAGDRFVPRIVAQFEI
jgi:hypothetical protein